MHKRIAKPDWCTCLFAAVLAAAATPYQFVMVGNPDDVQPHPQSGFALVGGGEDLPEVSQWLTQRAAGGDVVVLRASGGDAYNAQFWKAGRVNSVSTLVVKTPEATGDPFVAAKIRNAEALFLAGGDQWNYVRVWNHSPVGDGINSAIRRGVPLGGTSAGLAVLGEYAFTAENDTVTSEQALANPYDPRVTIANNFLHVPALRNTITDSHFHARDRMGRSLVFLARMLTDYPLREARGIAIDEQTAALVEPGGHLRVTGHGAVYFLRAQSKPTVCERGKPLSLEPIDVYRLPASAQFNLATWQATGGAAYRLAVRGGKIVRVAGGLEIY